jgi:branched-chain amino acid aminotransferase
MTQGINLLILSFHKSRLSRHDASMNYTFKTHPNPASAERRAEVLASPGFGKHFTDHMLTITWSAGQGWHSPTVEAYGPIMMDPASAVLHYAQEIFEGMKAYRHADGSIWTFRPTANAARFNRSAKRLAMPEMPEAAFIQALETLVGIDKAWVSGNGEQSLYLRPFMFANEAFLGVRPANEYKFMVIASPVASYFAGGIKPVSIWLSSNFTRAAKGGTGAAKCGGNYAAGLAAQMEATANGCDQVCFLDAVERQWVEELGGMNLYFVMKDGSLVTPPTGGTILEGITRVSIFELSKGLGLTPQERPISVNEWKQGVVSGDVKEVFACGTAAVITPVGRLVWADAQGNKHEVGSGTIGDITTRLRASLMDIQYGRAPDPQGWMHKLV